MLKKLIKHEFKAVWKFLAMTAVFLACLTIVGVIGVHILYPEAVFYPDGYPEPGNYIIYESDGTTTVSIGKGTFTAMVFSLYIMVYVISAFLLTAGTYIYMWMRFHNSMYGFQGYLTNTLPTTPGKLILSKMITAVTWVSFSIVLMVSSILSLSAAVRSASGMERIKTTGNLFELKEYGISIFGTQVLFWLILIAAIFFSVLMMYGSSALGQLAKKNRGFIAVACYFIMTMVLNVASTIALVVGGLFYNRKGNDFFDYNAVAGSEQYINQWRYVVSNINWMCSFYLVLIIIGAVGLYALTHYVTSRKLNLE